MKKIILILIFSLFVFKAHAGCRFIKPIDGAMIEIGFNIMNDSKEVTFLNSFCFETMEKTYENGKLVLIIKLPMSPEDGKYYYFYLNDRGDIINKRIIK